MRSLLTRRTCKCGEWVRGDLIGEGAFGSVFKAHPVKLVKGFPIIMAVKVAEVLESEPSKVEALMTEGEILKQFQDCPFVIKYYGHEMTYNDNKPVCFNLLLEYAAGGTMRQRIEKASLVESQVKDFTRSILKGLHFIHKKGYVHCDIKPDNILLVPQVTFGSSHSECNFVPKIADFGTTKRACNMYFLHGTPRYCPPETVLSDIQGKPADIWALGCIVLEMLTGKLWPSKSGDDLSSWVSNPIIPSHLSEEAKDFLSKCLDINDSTRFTAERLLTHSFLSKPSNERVFASGFRPHMHSDHRLHLPKHLKCWS
ncbi:hypothetical protein M0R45_001007 [Rubus argutus]|uniref:Protein kinase domain-containing protein n=1 Tax=Rubus argutus TaxID=59490 RepID=A0AAW1VLV9_RUBAR